MLVGGGRFGGLRFEMRSALGLSCSAWYSVGLLRHAPRKDLSEGELKRTNVKSKAFPHSAPTPHQQRAILKYNRDLKLPSFFLLIFRSVVVRERYIL